MEMTNTTKLANEKENKQKNATVHSNSHSKVWINVRDRDILQWVSKVDDQTFQVIEAELCRCTKDYVLKENTVNIFDYNKEALDEYIDMSCFGDSYEDVVNTYGDEANQTIALAVAENLTHHQSDDYHYFRTTEALKNGLSVMFGLEAEIKSEWFSC